MNSFCDQDKYFMRVALSLAEKVKGRTFPNPAVGAVVVKNGKIVGEGATAVYGGAHAEIRALHAAGKKAHNAILYVTLEPCNHYGKTPPCTEAIVSAQIKKVIIAMKDPNPLVNGGGIRYLRKRNISVLIGLMREQATALNEDFCWSIQKKKPWITLKLAMTYDGRIADSAGSSKWITNFEARKFVHFLRSRHAAIAVGRGTLEKDNPQLTVRYVKGHSPVRMVFSTTKRINKRTFLVKDSKRIRSILVCSDGIPGTKEFTAQGLEIWYIGAKKGTKHLAVFLAMAYHEGITSIFIEGGQKLASSFLEQRLVNKLYICYGNKLIGNGINGFQFAKHFSLQKSIHLNRVSTLCFGDNFLICGYPEWED